jgi:hypothetical protein
MPDSIELRFDRAVLLRELGLPQESMNAYLELLAIVPSHFGALNNLGTLAMELGFQTAARTAYSEAIKHHPNNPMGHVNLASALARIDAVDDALRHFEIALSLNPSHPEAHQGISRLLSEIGREDVARSHRVQGFQKHSIKVLPFRGTGQPVNLLVLASAAGGAVPIWHHLDDHVFATTVVFVDFYEVERPLPPHDLVMNAIGDADCCKTSLDAAAVLLRQSRAPLINSPSRVMETGRLANARRFAELPGVRTAKMVVLTRHQLIDCDANSLLSPHGITFPLLFRSLGFHNGSFFSLIDDEKSLTKLLPAVPGDEMLFIQFLDARRRDGRIRKYRVMMIDGNFYPLHVAISRNWKIHFFSAEMADDPDNRAEDEAFLCDMQKVLGPRAMEALRRIEATLGLEYVGLDFSLSDTGDVILFEANACMVVNPPDQDKKWNYRRSAVQRILDAIRHLLTKTNSSISS